MRPFLIASVLVACAVGASTVPANADQEKKVWFESARAPAPVGLCKTDRALRERCMKRWNECQVTAHKGPSPCPGEWRTCCTPKPHP